MEGLVGAALGVEVGELGEGASSGVLVELLQGLDVGEVGTGLVGPVVEGGIRKEALGGVGHDGTGGRVLVVGPGDARLGQLLEDGALGHGELEEGLIVGAVASGGAGGDIGTVGVGWAGNGGEPAVEEGEVAGDGIEDADLVWSVVVDDLSSTGQVDRVISDGLLCDESTEVLLKLARLDEGLIWVEGAEHYSPANVSGFFCKTYPWRFFLRVSFTLLFSAFLDFFSEKNNKLTLHVNTADAVVWVIRRNIISSGTCADLVGLLGIRSVPIKSDSN